MRAPQLPSSVWNCHLSGLQIESDTLGSINPYAKPVGSFASCWVGQELRLSDFCKQQRWQLAATPCPGVTENRLWEAALPVFYVVTCPPVCTCWSKTIKIDMYIKYLECHWRCTLFLSIFFQGVLCGVYILRLPMKQKQSVQVRVTGVSGGIKNAIFTLFVYFVGNVGLVSYQMCISRNA